MVHKLKVSKNQKIIKLEFHIFRILIDKVNIIQKLKKSLRLVISFNNYTLSKIMITNNCIMFY